MTEPHSQRWTRKIRQVDNALFNAIVDLLPYYAMLLRADPVLGAVCEQLILGWEADRERVHFIYKAAWRKDHIQFSTIGAAADLIANERSFGRNGVLKCRDYSHHWDRMAAESFKLLDRRARALRLPSDSLPSKQET